MKWDKADLSACGHIQIIEHFLKSYSDLKDDLHQMIKNFSIENVMTKIVPMQEFAIAVPLTKERVNFCFKLVELRKRKIELVFS